MLMSFNYSRHRGLPHKPGGSASTLEFSRPARRSLHVTACMLAESLKGSFYIRSFNCIVTSTIVPIATGWNDSCRVGITPTEWYVAGRGAFARRTGLNYLFSALSILLSALAAGCAFRVTSWSMIQV